jgi:4-hydroxy-tetrahydrodipicolinate reductase
MIKVGVFGASGRVGKLIVENLKNDKEAKVGTVFVRSELDFSVEPETLVTNDFIAFLEASDIVIDFSLPEAMEALLECAIKNHSKPIVIGTTGLNEHQQNLIREVSSKMPILYATNMSFGVALLNKLVEIASKSLKDYSCEIIEMHHKHKKDAPSGTALTLANSVARARGLELEKVMISGRNGNIGARSEDEIAVMALRGGDIIGAHRVGFYGDGEFLELNHTATNRNTFANGAIKAAKWLINKENGLYTINDCLMS